MVARPELAVMVGSPLRVKVELPPKVNPVPWNVTFPRVKGLAAVIVDPTPGQKTTSLPSTHGISVGQLAESAKIELVASQVPPPPRPVPRVQSLLVPIASGSKFNTAAEA